MELTKEERKAVVLFRMEKAKNTFSEIENHIQHCYWHTAANRLYYACYYAVTALLIKNGYLAHTHSGVITLLNKHFVVEGIIGKEQSRLYGRILELRQKGDYSDWVIINEENIKPLVEPAEKFIDEIESLIIG